MDNFTKLLEVGFVATFGEIIQMDLSDSPYFEFRHNGINGVIQTSHCTIEDLQTCEKLCKTNWKYLYTTREWIPIFRYADHVDLSEVLDLEIMNPDLKLFDDEPDSWWATPKGFPRSQ